MPQNNKTQKRITKLNKALGLARMKLRYLDKSGKREIFESGLNQGFSDGTRLQLKTIQSYSFWERLKFAFTGKL